MADAKAPPRRGRARRFVVGALGLGALVLGAGNAWVALTTSRDIVPGVAEAPERPVAIVLGNRAFADGSVSPELEARVSVALELYRAKKVEGFFLSGAFYPEESYDEPGAMAGWLLRRGVPRQAIVLDRQGFRTAATMANAAAHGFRSVLVCTQPYHLPRALYFARHAGLTATGVAARSPPARFFVRAYIFLREMLARPEAVVEIAVRGVRAGSKS